MLPNLQDNSTVIEHFEITLVYNTVESCSICLFNKIILGQFSDGAKFGYDFPLRQCQAFHQKLLGQNSCDDLILFQTRGRYQTVLSEKFAKTHDICSAESPIKIVFLIAPACQLILAFYLLEVWAVHHIS